MKRQFFSARSLASNFILKSPPKISMMVRQIFRNLVIAAAGPLPGQLSVDNLKRWTKIRRGTFTEDFGQEATHLLCTREQFNKKVPRVKDALARGKHIHIVHFDWFEISTVNEKKQPESEYSMRSILAKQNAAKREQARIERGKREGERSVNSNFYHIYHDRNFFQYQIDITRDDEEKGETGQRYTLYLWESNAKPHLYWFTAKFMKKRGDSQPRFYRPSLCSGHWRQEMELFMDFFRIKTGIEWQDRVLKQGTMPNEFFQYSPPTGGKPVGRRLRFCYEYCLEVNAELRGIPWPPVKELPEPTAVEVMNGDDTPLPINNGDVSIQVVRDKQDIYADFSPPTDTKDQIQPDALLLEGNKGASSPKPRDEEIKDAHQCPNEQGREQTAQ